MSPSPLDVLIFALAMKLFVTLILTVWLAVPAGAQTASTMTGRATDQNGGVLPGVAVTVRNLGTRLTRTGTTGAEGRFTIAGLPAGSYELTAELQGFRTVVLSPVTTTVGEAVDVNLVLPIGGIAEQLTISGAVSPVNTRSFANRLMPSGV